MDDKQKYGYLQVHLHLHEGEGCVLELLPAAVPHDVVQIGVVPLALLSLQSIVQISLWKGIATRQLQNFIRQSKHLNYAQIVEDMMYLPIILGLEDLQQNKVNGKQQPTTTCGRQS